MTAQFARSLADLTVLVDLLETHLLAQKLKKPKKIVIAQVEELSLTASGVGSRYVPRESTLAYLATRQVSHDVAAPAAAPPSLAEADDATLACALIEKHPQAPRITWARFSPLVRRILRRSLGPQHDVEDIVQDVFLCLFERVHTLRDPVAFKAFVIAITVRTARYEIRRARVRRWVGLSRTAELPDLRVVNADTTSQHALIHFYRALNRINERDRTAFILRFIEGMEAAEVAAALEVSVPTARRCFTRAWERVTFFAERDPFLVDYLRKLEVTSPEEPP